MLDSFDFAAMVLTPDDLIESRGENHSSPRDNVLFELGLFMGRLGRERTFIVTEHGVNLKLPTDLLSITRAPYRPRANLAAAVSPACTLIIRAMKTLGQFQGRQSAQLSRAAGEIEGVSGTITKLISLLARSRTVELEIVEQQFGRMIPSDQMSRIKKDLADLKDLLDERTK